MSEPTTSSFRIDRRAKWLFLVLAAAIFLMTGEGARARQPELDPKETAVRKVGVAVFSIKGREPDRSSAIEFSKALASFLKARSYFEIKAIRQNLELKGNARKVRALARGNGLDALLVGEIRAGEIEIHLVAGSTGRILQIYAISRSNDLKGKTEIQSEAQVAGDQIIREFPYRGFVSRVQDGLIAVNLGKFHGVSVGDQLKLFEFKGVPHPGVSPFFSERRWVGEAQVVRLEGDRTSWAKPTRGAASMGLHHKVAFAEAVTHPMKVETVTPSGPIRRLYLGGALVTINAAETAPGFEDKAYKLHSTPSIELGLQIWKSSLSVLYSPAGNDQLDLAYTEIILLTDFFEKAIGRNVFALSGGARLGFFDVTPLGPTRPPMESSTSVAPAVDLRFERLLGPSVYLLLNGSLFYPMLNTGQENGSLAFSVGGTGGLGARLNLNSLLALETGLRIKYFRKPIDGVSGLQETQSLVYGGVWVNF